MRNKHIIDALRIFSQLPQDEQRELLYTDDEHLPEVLKKIGIELPSSSWLLRVLKIVLYGLGIILAGIGTANAASLWF